MCVGLPAKVMDTHDGVAVINAGGAEREVSSEMIADLAPGDYVMVHAGAAISKITSDDQSETQDLLEEYL